MVYIEAVALADDPFTFQHSSGFISLRPFLFHFGSAIVVGVFGFVITHLWFHFERGDVIATSVLYFFKTTDIKQYAGLNILPIVSISPASHQDIIRLEFVLE